RTESRAAPSWWWDNSFASSKRCRSTTPEWDPPQAQGQPRTSRARWPKDGTGCRGERQGSGAILCMTHDASNRKNTAGEPGSSTIRLGTTTAAALRVLNLCPLLPADAFRHLVHLRSAGGAYRVLGNLKRARLAEVERVDVGYLLADRPLGLWSLTEPGRRACASAHLTGIGHHSGAPERTLSIHEARSRALRRTSLTLLVATYRLLAFLVAERCVEDQKTELCAWEQPWCRRFWYSEQDDDLRVRLPACAACETTAGKADFGNVGCE